MLRSLARDVVVNTAEADAVKRVQEETDGLGADVVVEAVGLTETWELSQRLVRKGGTILLFGRTNRAEARCQRTHTQYIMAK
jgi:alcohol dehydrogenase